jgi:uncharacterized protein YkwD
VGVGIEPGRDAPVYTFLLALPKRTFEAREAAPLADLEAVRRAIVERVNTLRRAADRLPLAPDPRLDLAAQRHAQDMLERGYYGHQSPEGAGPADRLRAGGYRARVAGENIAKGLFTPLDAVERWLASSGHRRNLLAREFASTGVGVAVGEGSRGLEVLWVQVFAAE